MEKGTHIYIIMAQIWYRSEDRKKSRRMQWRRDGDICKYTVVSEWIL